MSIQNLWNISLKFSKKLLQNCHARISNLFENLYSVPISVVISIIFRTIVNKNSCIFTKINFDFKLINVWIIIMLKGSGQKAAADFDEPIISLINNPAWLSTRDKRNVWSKPRECIFHNSYYLSSTIITTYYTLRALQITIVHLKCSTLLTNFRST